MVRAENAGAAININGLSGGVSAALVSTNDDVAKVAFDNGTEYRLC